MKLKYSVEFVLEVSEEKYPFLYKEEICNLEKANAFAYGLDDILPGNDDPSLQIVVSVVE